MSQRADQLHATADRQIADLIDLIPTVSDAVLRQPCPGREKLGDGTIGALIAHTTDSYQRIGTFVATSSQMSAGHNDHRPRGLRTPGFLRALGHQTREHTHGAVAHEHGDRYSAGNVTAADVTARLSDAREALRRIAELDDQRLDTIPPRDSFRFCDGQRTLEQVLTGLLNHQDHQVKAIQAALTRTKPPS
jgi:hypothetical protein